MLSLILGSLALWLVWRVASSASNASETRRLRAEDWSNWHAALERDPRNASARAFIAERCVEEGDLERAIHEFRTAINIFPYGPHTARWKRKLKAALEWQAQLDHARVTGERIPEERDWRVCPECDAIVLLREKNCPGCGAALRVGFLEWSLDSNNQRDVWRATLPVALFLWGAAIIFSTLSLQWKGAVIIVSVILCGYFFLRSFDDLR